MFFNLLPPSHLKFIPTLKFANVRFFVDLIKKGLSKETASNKRHLEIFLKFINGGLT